MPEDALQRAIIYATAALDLAAGQLRSSRSRPSYSNFTDAFSEVAFTPLRQVLRDASALPAHSEEAKRTIAALRSAVDTGALHPRVRAVIAAALGDFAEDPAQSVTLLVALDAAALLFAHERQQDIAASVAAVISDQLATPGRRASA